MVSQGNLQVTEHTKNNKLNHELNEYQQELTVKILSA